MSASIIRLGWICILSLFLGFAAQAQKKSELQQKKKQLQKEIIYTNKLLKETSSSKKTTLGQLRQLNRKMAAREALIKAFETEIVLLNDSIDQEEQLIDSLETELTELKQEYGRMLQYAYKNRSAYNRLMFLFSAENFNQAYKRLKYTQQYARFRKEQANKIVLMSDEIDGKIRALEAVRESKKGLLKAKQNERNNLAVEQQQQQKVVRKLQGREKDLKKQLAEKQKAANKLAKAIQKIIEEERRKAQEAARKAGKNSKGFPMTPEALKLSNSFTANKGKLPWPVAEGVITSHFGEHPHPVLKGLKVQNNGVDISTSKNAIGRAIFDGEVSAIIIIPGEGKGIMVRHGEYLSIYTYFKEVFVKKGDKVNTKQDLGVLVDQDNGDATIIHLEVWKDTSKLNPEYWIYRK